MNWNWQLQYLETVDNVFGKTRTADTEINQKYYALNACEFLLAKTLRKHCDHEGKEIDTEVSADILHQMGLVYQNRTPDKIHLIKAAALMNAAVCRKSSNAHLIKKDLQKLHSHVFNLAGTVHKDFDLQQESKNCSKGLQIMRAKVDTMVNNLGGPEPAEFGNFDEFKEEKSNSLEEIQEWITAEYVALMNEVMCFCVEAMGTPPCEYALVAMGSLAKLEITPYSDFENCIILQRGTQMLPSYEEIRDYFSWVGVLFQLILVGIGETIVRFLSIPTLNDPQNRTEDWFYDIYTPCGVCPDGLDQKASKNSVSKDSKLIKSVDEMLKYVDPDSRAAEDPLLAEMLTRTRFVSGHITTLNDFKKEVLKLEQKQSSYKYKISQLEECLHDFATTKKLLYIHDKREIDMKRIVFRSTTLFVSALARCHGVLDASSFKVINTLRERRIISSDFARDLRFAVAVACAVRLSVYCKWRSHKDRIKSRPETNLTGSNLREIMGEKTSVVYFQTACELQSMGFQLVSQKRVETKDVELEKKLSTVTVFYSLSLYDKALEESSRFGWLELSEDSTTPPKCLHVVGECYFGKKFYNIAVVYLLAAQKGFEAISKPPHLDLIDCILKLMRCFDVMGRHAQSTQYLALAMYYQKYLNVDDKVPFSRNSLLNFSPHTDKYQETHYAVAAKLHFIGKWSLATTAFQSPKALSCFKRELALRERLTANRASNARVAKCHVCIGQCLVLQNKHKEALEEFKNAKSIFDKCKGNFDRQFCRLNQLLGAVYLDLGDQESSLFHFEEESRLIFESDREISLKKVADCFFNIGLLHSYKLRSELALLYLNTALDILDTLVPSEKCSVMVRACKVSIDRIKIIARTQALIHR